LASRPVAPVVAPDAPTFETLPLVHLERGRFPEYPGPDTEVVLTRLARSFGRVVLVDAAGVRSNDADLEFLQFASRKRAIWADAGSRFATDAMDLFVAGAEAVTMRWNTLDAPAELAEAASLAQEGALFVGLEFPRGAFLKHPRDGRDAAGVLAMAQELGIGAVLQVDRVDLATARALPPASVTKWIQGSATSDAATELQALGFHGAVVGPVTLEAEL
jgi:hypothetical protein